jgi:hypothetical protein
MKFNIEILKELKNKRNELKQKVIRITNNDQKEGLDIDVINEIYHDLLTKYDSKNILITGKSMIGGIVTLKSYTYTGDNIKYTDDDYFDSAPKEVKERLIHRDYSIDITVKIPPKKN